MSNYKRIHFIGVGGIGMSGLARLYLHEGAVVSGSDRALSDLTRALEAEGVTFFAEQSAENITNDIDLVVYTEAMSKDHPEMTAARALGVPMMNYFEALGAVANEYYLIAVAGTHGKTTTTAMLIDIFEQAGLDPTAIVGSLRSSTGKNYRAGKSKYFIVEACEYKRDFLSLNPDVLVITNIEPEHLDYYHDLADIQSAFTELATKVPAEGAIIASVRDANVAPVLEGVAATVIDYKDSVDLVSPMKQPGLHNRFNAAAARAAATFCGVAEGVAGQATSEFAGTWRRFEYKGELQGAPIYDDYAHHPTELAATMAGARELYPDKNLVVVFQPHLYSRTAEQFDGFVAELSKGDQVILTHVYDARDTGGGVTGERLAVAVKEKNPNTEYFEKFDDIVANLKETIIKDDVVLVVGAGDVSSVATNLTKHF
ncbi:UDP-N-acetylmuramate--L-alanine ligase [Candidatus Kaiserbacteria bacterium]|nr:UDP-N-acetylmuramate--L-alanine ligase [Candidatus Kaiserbacteria bacterium]MCB9811674.1 UDP-N-acetylmuramate--L-alanine ligase [Candidatus Nomurabacteria bacterium]